MKDWGWILLMLSIIGYGVAVWINEIYVVANGGDGLMGVIRGMM